MLPADTAWDFLQTLRAIYYTSPEELHHNRRRGWLYSTWRFIALLAPQGVSPIVRSLFPDEFVHREIDRKVMEALRREAMYLIRGSSSRIVHRARILYPDGGPAERANVILIDLDLVGKQLESYSDYIFEGAIEIYDRATDDPLDYRSGRKMVRTPTPPGFRTVEELKAMGALRKPGQDR